MAKDLLFSQEAHQKILSGVEQMANAVGATLGPRGRNVVIDKKFGAPQITKDGVTVAKDIELSDPFENMGSQLLKEVASKTNDTAGDGTTTATILAHSIIREGFKNVTAGANPTLVKRGIDKATDVVIKEIQKKSKLVNSDAEIMQVASISANNDPEVGKFIAEAFKAVGKEGVITVEESKSLETLVDVVEGMQFDRGYLSPYMATNAENLTAELDNPFILLTDTKISTTKDLVPVLEFVHQQNRPLLMIAEDVDGEALTALIVNKLRGVLNVVAVKAPAFGDRRKAMLEDIAILTGGEVVSSEKGMSLSEFDPTILGGAKRVQVTKDLTTIVDALGTKDAVQSRVKMIEKQSQDTSSDYDREKLQERKAKLSGGVAVIKVGAATEVELKEKKDRFNDALSATKAASEEGIVPGGGLSLLIAREALNSLQGSNPEEQVGIDIVYRALESPMRIIAENSGIDGAIIIMKAKEAKPGMGYNALTGEWVDMLQAGIVDPAKVERCALQNAASIAGLLLTTEVMLTDHPEPKSDPVPPPGGMGGMM